MRTTIGELLSKRAFVSPRAEALVDVASDRRFSFTELDRLATTAAAGLAELGVAKGERVALLCMNSAEFVATYLGSARLGAVVVPLNWRLMAEELAFILGDSGASTLVFSDEFASVASALHDRGTDGPEPDRLGVSTWVQVGGNAAFQGVREFAEVLDAGARATAPPLPHVVEDDLLYIMDTSGTTGRPKGAMHTHASTFAAIMNMAQSMDYRTGDRYLNCMPLFHVGALQPLNAVLYRAGSPVPVSLLERYVAMGIEIHQGYGLTECGGPATILSGADAVAKLGSAGKAFFHADVAVVDPSGADCPPDQPGEIVVRSAANMVSYWNRDEATAATLRDGWLHTGDVAAMDVDGFVTILDRLTDMIISGGENIYPAELEDVILGHAGVAEVAVIAQPSERWGESPCAVIVRRDEDLTAADVLAWCEARLARFKQPRSVVFTEAIPRNPSGKALKRLLREQFPGPSPG